MTYVHNKWITYVLTDSTLQLVSMESLWPSFPLLHVLCPNWGPSIPSLGFDPKATTCPFHFSLPPRNLILTGHPTTLSFFSFFQGSCEWLVSKLPSGSSASFSAFSRLPSSFSRFLGFLSKDPFLGGWRTRLWPKFRSSSFWLFFSFTFLLFGPLGFHGPS